MTEDSKQLSELAPKGRQVVELLVRFGIMVVPALQRFDSACSGEAARKLMDRLVSSGWLNRHRFPSGINYYVLSDAACQRLGVKRDGRALRQQPLVKRTMVLLHFSARSSQQLLTSSECREHLPGLYQRGAAHFFIDADANSLGWICLDQGRDPQRVYMKARSIAAKRRAVNEIRQLAVEGRFRLLVLTTTEAKAEQLRELFASRPIHGVPVEVAADSLSVPLILPSLE